MTQSTRWPSAFNRPPAYIRAPRRVWWGGHSLVVHLDQQCPGGGGLWCNPQHLDWNRVRLCKRCTSRAWKEGLGPIDTIGKGRLQ